MNEYEKITVILSLLNERYNASHKMRERGLNYTIWILGYGILLIGFLLNKKYISISEKIFLFFITVVIYGCSLWFLSCLEKGFSNNCSVMINLETILHCYEKGFYSESTALLPDRYKENQKKTLTGHFLSIYILIISITVSICILILFHPIDKYESKKINNKQQIEIEQIKK